MRRRSVALLLLVVVTGCAGRKPPPPEPVPLPPQPTSLPPAAAPTPLPAPVIPPPTAVVTGTVTYRQRIALTPEAQIQVELRDVSLADVPSPVIAKQVISQPGQVPIDFTLEYDPTKILPGRSYAVSARITDRGQLQFVTDSRVPVLTGGTPEPVEIVVVPVR